MYEPIFVPAGTVHLISLSPCYQRAVSAVRRLKLLNPNVDITADTNSVEDKPEEFFTNYNLVCLTSCSLETMVRP